MSRRWSTPLVCLALLTLARVLLAAPVTVAGKALQLTLDADAGAVTGLKHAASAFDFLQAQPAAKRYLWELTVRTPAGPQYRLRPEHARQLDSEALAALASQAKRKAKQVPGYSLHLIEALQRTG